jgi:hypothetical protein
MDRMIKTSLAIGILLIGISTSYYFIFFLPAMQKQRLATQVAQTVLDQDQKCAKGAKEFFSEGGWANKNALAGYENHFNRNLNRCYIYVQDTTSMGTTLFTYKMLADVNDGKTVAEYDKRIPSGVADYEVKPIVCDMLDKYCQSVDEFEAFVKTYMEP